MILVNLLAACTPVRLDIGKTQTPQFDPNPAWREQPALDLLGHVRFVAVGDAGSDTVVAKRLVADAKMRCGGTCDFVVLLGDNVYEHGLNNRKSEQFLEGYASSWGLPLGLVLGNHDWGGRGLIGRPRRPQKELDWVLGNRLDGSFVEPRVRRFGSSHFWSLEAGDLHLVGLDTTYLHRRPGALEFELEPLLGFAGDAPALTGDLFATARPGMQTVVLGHHPWRSTGMHGSADGDLAALFARSSFPLYLAGHDHLNNVWLEEDRTQLSLVLGAGAKQPRASTPTLDPRLLLADTEAGYAVIDVWQGGMRVEVTTDVANDFACRLVLEHVDGVWSDQRVSACPPLPPKPTARTRP